ncbi:hypothetical protein HY745_10805 [Candidatus Desantisbacteria bacterium]|nr:hypothetical protein [Candidatus Desantisbacteria bacterium]
MKECLRILVIDKNLETENFLNKTMKDYISTIETATCIEDGIEKIPGLNPDLIFLDLGLPAKNFQETINKIKIINPYTVIFLLLDNDKY